MASSVAFMTAAPVASPSKLPDTGDDSLLGRLPRS